MSARTGVIDKYGLTGKTENTTTHRDALYEELDRVEEQGYALNDEKEIVGHRRPDYEPA